MPHGFICGYRLVQCKGSGRMNVDAQIKKGRKYDQVIEGAREVFMADGFEGASVDTIAKCAGVSKATLYSYFADKRLLFVEVACAECRRQAGEVIEQLDFGCPPREFLTRAGAALMVSRRLATRPARSMARTSRG